MHLDYNLSFRGVKRPGG